MDAISLDLIGLTYPDACIGSMGDRLLLAGLWSIFSIMIGGASLACYALVEWLLSGRADALRRDSLEQLPQLDPLEHAAVVGVVEPEHGVDVLLVLDVVAVAEDRVPRVVP